MPRPNRSAAILFGGGILLVVLIAASFGSRWLDWVVVLQSGPISIPSTDIVGDYMTGAMWAFGLSLLVFAWGITVRMKGPLLVVWLAKISVALGFMMFYDYAYGVDPDGYFVNASMPGFSWSALQIGEGTQNTQRLAWLHFHFLSTSYHAARISFALVGLIGVYLVYRAGVMCTGRADRRLFYAFGLMPSILFWSTILGKDPIVFTGIAAYTYGVIGWHTSGKLRYLLASAIGLIIAVYIRQWFGPILLIPLAVLGWMRTRGVTARVAFVALGVVGLLAFPGVVERGLGVDITKQDQFLETADTMARIFPAGGSTQDVPDLLTFGNLAGFAPLGMFTALFRPLPGEVPNFFGTLAGLENLLLLFLAVRAVSRTRFRELKEPLVLWAVSIVVLWAALYSVAAFQNLGTLSRYRLQITPLFFGILFYLGRRRDEVSQPVPSAAPRTLRLQIWQAGRVSRDGGAAVSEMSARR